MKIRRWELTVTEDGEKYTSYHRNESDAVQALYENHNQVVDDGDDEDAGVEDGVIVDLDLFKDYLSNYAYLDVYIEEEIINTDEWEEVK